MHKPVSLRGLGCLALLAAGLALNACAADRADEDTSEAEAQLSAPAPPPAPPRKQLTICFSGAAFLSPYNSDGNSELGDLCERMPGLIRGGRYPFFTWSIEEIFPLAFFMKAADTNQDGRVTAADEPFDLNVIGFSWGGYNARDFIELIEDSSRIEVKTVARFFALDAFKITMLTRKTSMRVPENVRQFWAFRHTEAPENDCSDGMPWGPFTGRRPTCSEGTQCTDYDYSLSPNSWFYGYSGKSVGHCTLPSVATQPILDIVAGRAPSNVPPARTVEIDD